VVGCIPFSKATTFAMSSILKLEMNSMMNRKKKLMLGLSAFSEGFIALFGRKCAVVRSAISFAPALAGPLERSFGNFVCCSSFLDVCWWKSLSQWRDGASVKW
jgi:hypothetical protein